jgi:membrane fusion protein, multidrug efflux system
MDDLKLREEVSPDVPGDVRESPPRPDAPTRPRGSIGRRLAWLAAGILVVVAIAWWIHGRPSPQGAAPRFAVSGPMPIRADTAQQGTVAITLDELGTVTPLATVTVRTQISGQLMSILFQEGQTVAKGDLLAEIDSRPYVHALGQAEGQLARDQALLKNAELDLARYRKLVAQDSIPRQQLDTQDSLVHQYVGTVETDQALVDNARLNVAYCHITAPISGRVGLRQVDQGNYVQTNDTNGIVVITQIQPITVIFTVAEDELPAIMTRLHAGAVLPVTAYDRSRSAELATGRLTTVDNQIDTSTGTVKLRAEFDNADLKLFPNQFVTVRLTVDELHDATTIASAAVQRGAAGTFVYLIKPDDTVTVRPVTLGPSEGERAAVQSGLAPGDQVVVDGADKLRDGAKVARRATTGAAAPAAGAAPSAAKKGRGAKP